MSRPTLTESERQFLKALRRLVKLQLPFTYRRMADLVGWRSVGRVWQVERDLREKGVIRPGKRLALTDGPVEVEARAA